MRKVRSRYNYRPIISKDYLCVPYALKIIIDASLGEEIEIELVSNFFNVYRPKDTNDMNKFGAIINKDDVNSMFNELGLPLKEKYIPINSIAEYEFCDVVAECLKNGDHVIFGYSYGYLYGIDKYAQLGHVSIITEINGEMITILNPGPDNYGYHTFKYDDVYSAIRKKRDGIWIIKPRD